ncbi:MAG: carbohydrate ABC transporter permease [Lachnospiraceae bacterium]|jgi:multiple sugar transport system permease protein/putative aldouronate transport system permease protein|nr:carbohydrate ABC transporter permease [Lachnospiraceae bacterium]
MNNIAKNRISASRDDLVYYIISGFIMSVLLVMALYPMVFVLSASFSSGDAVSSGKVILWPVELNLEGYKTVFRNNDILRAYWNTLLYTAAGTLINVSMALITAYPLSRRDLRGRGFLMLIFTFTMFFSGGMIPSYINISNLHLMNTFWVMVLPGALSVYNMIVTRTFIQTSIPYEMLEAASIDGCNDTKYFFSFVLPLSKAIIAVNTLFSAVNHWNAYFNAMIYLNDRDKLPLQNIMRELLVLNEMNLSDLVDPEQALLMLNSVAVLKYALIVVATVPILCAYPFAQKYFVKGVMIGSVKG